MGIEARDPETGLTVKEEAFAQLMAKGINAVTSYIKSHNPKTTKKHSLYPLASRVAQDDKVKARIAAIRAAAQEKATSYLSYSRIDAIRECEEAYAIAQANDDAAAMKGCIELKAKLQGLLIDRKAVVNDPFAGLNDDQLAQAIKNIQDSIRAEIQGVMPTPGDQAGVQDPSKPAQPDVPTTH